MNFKDVILPNHVITEMYKSTLVQDVQRQPSISQGLATDPAKIEVAVPFRGKNGQRIAVIVASEKKISDTSSETVFLLKILKACNLTMEDIALIDLKHVSQPFDVFLKTFDPHKVLLFSSSLFGVPLAPELTFQVQKTSGIDIVYAPEVKAMLQENAEAVVLKKKLWMTLKNFFNV